MLREDLNHPFVSGNKWWKLRDNLKEAVRTGKPILTFGGAYSNHIYATAAASNELGIASIGIVRGEPGEKESETLTFAKRMGMSVHHVSRESYRKKEEDSFLNKMKQKFGDVYIIPEGGTNELAVRCCQEWGAKILNKYGEQFDYICISAGTGGSAAGIISVMSDKKKVVVFSALKNGLFLSDQILEHLRSLGTDRITNYTLQTDYHFGGYGKANNEVLDFINKTKSVLPLDGVYTAKLLLGTIDLCKKGFFTRGSHVLVIHTGGLQGNSGFN